MATAEARGEARGRARVEARDRARGRVVGLAGLAASAAVIAGALLFAVASTWPIRVHHTVTVPVLQQTGEFDKALVPTGRTEQVDKTDTCIPLRRIVAIGGNDDPDVCHGPDEPRLALARVGLEAAAAGLALVVLLVVGGVLAERRATRRALRPRSTPAPR